MSQLLSVNEVAAGQKADGLARRPENTSDSETQPDEEEEGANAARRSGERDARPHASHQRDSHREPEELAAKAAIPRIHWVAMGECPEVG